MSFPSLDELPTITPSTAVQPSAPVQPATELAVHVLHDNPEWLPPFRRAFAAEGIPLVEVPLGTGMLDLDSEPPRGVIWSRLSASSHTRDAPLAKDAARSLTAWAESWGRRVVNGQQVADLEVSKVLQHAALRRAGIDVPRTLAVFGREGLLEAAHGMDAPFITKHNQGGKGLGVRRFDTHEGFAAYLEGPDFEEAARRIARCLGTLLREEERREHGTGGAGPEKIRTAVRGVAFRLRWPSPRGRVERTQAGRRGRAGRSLPRISSTLEVPL